MYKLGKRSLLELEGVKEDLVKVVDLAITITNQDFTVFDGLRTFEEQQEMVRRGASKTLKSKHLTGDAVDLVPWINGKARWEWNAIYPIAQAMQKAAEELDVDIRWGGVWDLPLRELDGCNLKVEVHNYAGSNSPAFLDGPHYELIS